MIVTVEYRVLGTASVKGASRESMGRAAVNFMMRVEGLS